MDQRSTFAQIEKIGGIAGVVSIIFYIWAVLLPLPDTIARLMAFDIFIAIALFIFGINLARSEKLPSFLSIVMSLIALNILVLNMITFPYAPAEAGLIDMGPFMGLWMLIVYIWFTVAVFKNNKQLAA